MPHRVLNVALTVVAPNKNLMYLPLLGLEPGGSRLSVPIRMSRDKLERISEQ